VTASVPPPVQLPPQGVSLWLLPKHLCHRHRVAASNPPSYTTKQNSFRPEVADTHNHSYPRTRHKIPAFRQPLPCLRKLQLHSNQRTPPSCAPSSRTTTRLRSARLRPSASVRSTLTAFPYVSSYHHTLCPSSPCIVQDPKVDGAMSSPPKGCLVAACVRCPASPIASSETRLTISHLGHLREGRQERHRFD
jgi:hypothetical protein